MNSSLTSDNTISVELLLVHAEVVTPVGDELIVFYERAWVKEQFNSFASCQFVLLMLLVNSSLTASEKRLLSNLFPFLDKSGSWIRW